MSLSATQISASLPRIRELLDNWKSSPSVESKEKGNEPKQATTTGREVIVAFRTRPTLSWEAAMLAEQVRMTSDQQIEKDQEESLLCSGITMVDQNPGVTVAHVPTMKWNGPAITHKVFDSDLAFGPRVSTEEIFQKTIEAQDMIPLVLSGGVACVLAYGQTGAGKTYTMTSLETFVARSLFENATKLGAEMQSQVPQNTSDVFEITTTFVEIVGKSVYDLGGEHNADGDRKPVSIGEDKLGKVRPDLISSRVTTAAELEAVIERCLSHRRSAATTRNAASSRSHAILNIRVKNLLIPELEDGEFFLVDLAGSERYEDRKAHSAELMEQSKENNKSLLALKECVRSRAKAAAEDGFVHIPYRSSRLTWVLKAIFDMEETRPSKTLVIAHVSPHIQDVSHSVNTLTYAAPFRILPPRRAPAPYDAEDPRTWGNKSTITWLRDAFKEQKKLRRENEWRRQDADARLQGKCLHPLMPFQNTQDCIIDLESFCPDPQGGTFLARMYGAEWVQKCLKHRNSALGVDEDALVFAIQQDGLSVYLDFAQLLVIARTKSRNAVMKNRRVVEHTPDDYEPPQKTLVERMAEDDRFEYQSQYTDDRIRVIARGWMEKGHPSTTVYMDVYKATVADFLKAKAEAQAAGDDKTKDAEDNIVEYISFADIVV
ncbi:P-loop containing nucleoside triphosphate hydrolase protein [Crucibulum laeve]|uniref:Kinesin-like protein n=1 Tax=Crucibulum laeve TaxID=68775 RepID=A0A5C3LKZ7_9AGAR|nr:P-loop containing nucleoside triphosphate hydrolase protein [Crucibulum laeve]